MVADYTNFIIILPYKPLNVTIKMKDKIKCYDGKNRMIEIYVSEIINEVTFKIKDLEDEYTSDKIFVYGTYVDDLQILFKEHIFTLNVGATHELSRQIKKQKEIIESQEFRMDILERRNEVLNEHYNKLLEEIEGKKG